jgi:Helicase C-terminal domain
MVVMRPGTEMPDPSELVSELHTFLEKHQKALWLCARADTARAFEASIVLSGLPGECRRLEGDNGADEPFAAEPLGHLVAAGRYDGMDFPGDSCRVEVMPEIPVATSDLEEFVSAYLRDAPFAEARLGQRVAQALGRCNRSENDRAVYVLTDPEFVGRFSQRRSLDALSSDVRDDVYAALERSDRGFGAGLDEATTFLSGDYVDVPQAPPATQTRTAVPETAEKEVKAILALWREDYGGASAACDLVAAGLAGSHEHRAFWLAMRALALRLAGKFGDRAAEADSRSAMHAAASAGSSSTFFTRLRLAETRLTGNVVPGPQDLYDNLFAAWDRIIDRLGTQGPRLDRWFEALMKDLRSETHDRVASGVAQVGAELLGLSASARQAVKGEEDAYWDFSSPRRILAFEVKLAPTSRKVTNDDVEQAEGAAKALATHHQCPVRGILISPHSAVDETAVARLERIRLIHRDLFIEQVNKLVAPFREYRRGWGTDSLARAARRSAVQSDLPAPDWLWKTLEATTVWVEAAELDKAWRSRPK